MGRKPQKRRSTHGPVAAARPESEARQRFSRGRAAELAVCGLLLLAVLLVFGQTVQFEFVDYDDAGYVSENPHVTQGLTVESVLWAFTGPHGGNWHPLTSLSHLLDYQLFGKDSGGHHAVNVLLHAATAILLFQVLWRMTGNLWPAAFAAAMFAVHPLRAESVAWVSERKDVLSGVFFMLTLAAYLGYVRHPFSVARYAALLLAFGLGLMSKPMLVTLPFLLLLLDYWPLGRIVAGTQLGWGGSCTATPTAAAQSPPQPRIHLIVEKLPLFFLAAVSCMATVAAQQQAVISLELMSPDVRITNALFACMAYVGQFFYPVGLSAYYPHLGPNLPLWKPAVAFVFLTGVSISALLGRRRFPALLVGWFWYLGMLVPVVGLMQVGTQSRADRYTYLPEIGLCIALTWCLAGKTLSSVGQTFLSAIKGSPGPPDGNVCSTGAKSNGRRRWKCVAFSAILLATLATLAWRQTSFSRNSETLWTHALNCTVNNLRAHNHVGYILFSRGDIDHASAEFQGRSESTLTMPRPATILAPPSSNKGRSIRQSNSFRRHCLYRPIRPKLPRPTQGWAIFLPTADSSTWPPTIIAAN